MFLEVPLKKVIQRGSHLCCIKAAPEGSARRLYPILALGSELGKLLLSLAFTGFLASNFCCKVRLQGRA